MVDEAYKNALAKRSVLAREIERIDTFLELYREFGGSPMEEYSSSKTSSEHRDDISGVSSDRAPKGATAKITEAAEQVILAAQRPRPRADLLKEIEARGIVIGGKDPAATLSSALWRERDRFVNIKGFGYWLKHLKYDPAFYDPELEELMGTTEEIPQE
ncbi:MAG: hypothetical protein ABSA13_11750 [Beijerinckiaceae bacterium]|jgi:hypothetical protein